MKRILVFFTALILSVCGYSQYPIQTIFKGDSVVILTIKQSEEINKTIEKTKDINKENKNKITKLKIVIDSLNQIVDKKDNQILILSQLKDSIQKSNDEFIDSIWKWSLSPSIIFTQNKNDTILYVIDLSRYYLTTDEYGIFLPRMKESEYNDFIKFINSDGDENNSQRRGFGGLGDMEYLGSERARQRKVWKHKSKWKNK
jgi:hypothetical protein